MTITKQQIEEEVGFEIESFELKPKYENDFCIGLDVFVVPKINIKAIEIPVTIKFV